MGLKQSEKVKRSERCELYMCVEISDVRKGPLLEVRSLQRSEGKSKKRLAKVSESTKGKPERRLDKTGRAGREM